MYITLNVHNSNKASFFGLFVAVVVFCCLFFVLVFWSGSLTSNPIRIQFLGFMVPLLLSCGSN